MQAAISTNGITIYGLRSNSHVGKPQNSVRFRVGTNEE
jgi:hypothetical protein